MIDTIVTTLICRVLVETLLGKVLRVWHGLKSWFKGIGHFIKSTCPSFCLQQTFLELWNWELAPKIQDELQCRRQSQTFGCSKTCKWKLELWVAATFLTLVSHRDSHLGSKSLLWLQFQKCHPIIMGNQSKTEKFCHGDPKAERERNSRQYRALRVWLLSLVKFYPLHFIASV